MLSRWLKILWKLLYCGDGQCQCICVYILSVRIIKKNKKKTKKEQENAYKLKQNIVPDFEETGMWIIQELIDNMMEKSM